MRKKQSTLFAPYRTMGVVCSGITPSIVPAQTKLRYLSLFCAVDDYVIQYDAVKLKTISISPSLPFKVTAVIGYQHCVLAASGKYVYVIPFCRNIEKSYDIQAVIKFMLIMGDNLIVVDESNGIHVIDLAEGYEVLTISGSEHFDITSIHHPATYMNKVVLGSSKGSVRILNVRTGKVVHEFRELFKSPITVIEQSPALDVLAFGMESGKVHLHNIKMDESICSFKHDFPITSIGFRTDGEPIITTTDNSGRIAVWDLEKSELIGINAKIHTGAITKLHFLVGEPVMISCSEDNSVRTWALDGADRMPRLLNSLEGHSLPITAAQFVSKQEIITTGLDGAVRRSSVANPTLRQKLGNAGTMSRAKAKKKNIDLDSIKLEPVVEIAMGLTREAAWDNVLCRHRNSLVVTTWTSRKNSLGTHKLIHNRFLTNSSLLDATATSVCISACGNYGFIGYSSGHVDQYNVQSGRFVKTFGEDSETAEDKKARAHNSPVTALSVDVRGHELISCSASGEVKFWKMKSGQYISQLKTKLSIASCAQSPANSLLALSCNGRDGLGASVSIIDTLCRKVVRVFKVTDEKVSAIAFNADGRWLLAADETGLIRVWEVSTSQLVDVLLSEKKCIGIAFNDSGEFMATVHEDEIGVHIWANKSIFVAKIGIKAIPIDFVPDWDDDYACDDLEVQQFDFDSDSDSDEEAEMGSKIDSNLISFSGLPPSRWANLSNLALIKERNKPIEAPKKPKQAPFFLTAAPTLEGFQFEVEDKEDDPESRKELQAKRSLLELESSFSSSLKHASSEEDLIRVFKQLKSMSISAIDFQLRSLPSSVLPQFLNMLLVVLQTSNDFELVQSYLAAAIKIHRSELWNGSNSPEITEILEQLNISQEESWTRVEDLLVDNAAVIQWVKNALL